MSQNVSYKLVANETERIVMGNCAGITQYAEIKFTVDETE